MDRATKLTAAYWGAVVLFNFAASLQAVQEAELPPLIQWTTTFDSGGFDQANDVAVGEDGNPVVTGVSPSNAGDFRTIKYDGATGTLIWNVTFDSGGSDEAFGVSVGSDGNPVITGISSAASRTIKYDGATGAVLWNVILSPGGGLDVVIGPEGNPVVTGVSRTIKFDGATGAVLWNVPVGPSAFAGGVGAGEDGNPVVAGGSFTPEGFDLQVTKLDGMTGAVLWDVTFDTGASDVPQGVAVGPDGSPFVVALHHVPPGVNFQMAKFDGATGAVLWDVISDLGGNSFPDDVAVGPDGNPVATGSDSPSSGGIRTIKYDGGSGDILWSLTFGEASQGRGVSVGPDGNPVVTGRSFIGGTPDIRTIKYTRLQIFLVRIDINPGGFPNRIKPQSRGVIRVAILTTSTMDEEHLDFDATTVDETTVRFGVTGTEASPVHAALEDVDLDGDTDMILHFKTQDTGLQCGDNTAFLTGETFGEQAIRGTDSINTVGCN